MSTKKWTKEKIKRWLKDIYILLNSSEKEENKEGINQLLYLIEELNK